MTPRRDAASTYEQAIGTVSLELLGMQLDPRTGRRIVLRILRVILEYRHQRLFHRVRVVQPRNQQVVVHDELLVQAVLFSGPRMSPARLLRGV